MLNDDYDQLFFESILNLLNFVERRINETPLRMETKNATVAFDKKKYTSNNIISSITESESAIIAIRSIQT